jgi:glucan 1,3-beta-glucosidase
VEDSHDIVIFGEGRAVESERVCSAAITGAGLYSFFSVGRIAVASLMRSHVFGQAYTQACIDSASCQTQIANIDALSTVDIYGLTTVGTTWQLSVNQQGVIPHAPNANGFAATATCWTR